MAVRRLGAVFAALGLGFGPTVLSFNYTSYTSPGDYFAHVKDFGINAAFDVCTQRAWLLERVAFERCLHGDHAAGNPAHRR